ncbi:CapA family protein, partial [Saccharothrix sp. MB29]|nr:CapA family protein [Saccharothrix sp. MB29]
GDVMFGRRYATPPQEESSGRSEPLIPADDAAAGAQDVVAAIAPAFAAADFRTVNVETVISDRPADAAYPGKRYILQSAGPTVAGLRALSTDLAVLANNHSRDLLDAGVADTRAALSGAGIATVGAGANAAEAAEPHQRVLSGTGVGVLAYTSVDGSFVNESFPDDRAATRRRRRVRPVAVREQDLGLPGGGRAVRAAPHPRGVGAVQRGRGAGLDDQVAGMWPRWRRSTRRSRTGWHDAATAARPGGTTRRRPRRPSGSRSRLPW